MGHRAEHAVFTTFGHTGGHKIECETLLEEANARIRTTRSEEHPRQLAPRRITVCVHDAPTTMAALTRKFKSTLCVAIESHADLGQSFDFAWPFCNQCLNGRSFTERGARCQGVTSVIRSAIILRKRRGDAALRPCCIRLLEFVFRQQDHFAVLCGSKRGTEARDSRTDHECVCKDRRQQLRPEWNQVASILNR